MTFDKSKTIFEKINSTKLTRLKSELFECAIRYANIRAEWYFMSDEEKRNTDDLRTSTHNALIDACNILSREMIKSNEDANWRMELGNDRKEIGDFACYVQCFLGLTSR